MSCQGRTRRYAKWGDSNASDRGVGSTSIPGSIQYIPSVADDFEPDGADADAEVEIDVDMGGVSDEAPEAGVNSQPRRTSPSKCERAAAAPV